jgi:hypothetical protein
MILSRCVNEPFPSFQTLLTAHDAHDVARLTRRPKLVLSGLMLLGHFPTKSQKEAIPGPPDRLAAAHMTCRPLGRNDDQLVSVTEPAYPR